MKSIVTILGLVFWVLGLQAEVPPVQSITAQFPYSGNVTGTVFYIKQVAGAVTNVVAVVSNQTVVTLSNVVAGQYQWLVTASNFWGESDPSVPFITPAKPVTPGQLKPITTLFRVKPPVSFERTADLLSWEERFRLFQPDSNGVQVVMQTIRPEEEFTFYRVRPEPKPGLPR
jgi:hypothetical protein